MFRRIALSAIVLSAWAGVAVAGSGDNGRSQPTTSKPDCSFGTALQWEKHVDSAAKKAEREHKLLMVLAVAGHFEDPFFT